MDDARGTGVPAMTDLEPFQHHGGREVGTGYWRSKVLLSAVGLGLFTELADAPLTMREIRRTFGLQPRPAADFLDGLVSLGYSTAKVRATMPATGTRPRPHTSSTAGAPPTSAAFSSFGRRATFVFGPT
jgi:hypothetical protein